MQDNPRVRLVRRIELDTNAGIIDTDAARRACGQVRAGEDVVVVIRGSLSFDPGGAGALGRELAHCRSIQVEANGPGARAFTADLTRAAHAEAIG